MNKVIMRLEKIEYMIGMMNSYRTDKDFNSTSRSYILDSTSPYLSFEETRQ